MKRGEDIEILGEHHVAVVTGLIRHLNGTWTIYVTHDTDQGNAGGTVTEPITYDPSTGLLTGGAPGFFDGFTLDGFIDESPVPEPSMNMLVALGLALILSARKRRRNRGSVLPGM
jgi:hypothetical protein